MAEWVFLTRKDVNVVPVPEVGWVELTKDVFSIEAPSVGWTFLTRRDFQIQAPPVGWVELATLGVLLVPAEDPGEPPIPKPIPEPKKKIPWLPIALIGGGAVVLATAAKPKKPTGLTKSK